MSDQPRNGAPSSEAPGDESPFIFLAEDDIDDQEILIESFKALYPDMTVKAEVNGLRAIQFLQRLPDHLLPCLIVLDYNLPEVDGSEILQRLKEDNRFDPIPKVVWSTSNSDLFRSRSISMGAKAYFVKPTDINSINNLAKEMLSYCNIIV